MIRFVLVKTVLVSEWNVVTKDIDCAHWRENNCHLHNNSQKNITQFIIWSFVLLSGTLSNFIITACV